MENMEKGKRSNMNQGETSNQPIKPDDPPSSINNSNMCAGDGIQASSEGSMSTDQNNTSGIYKAKFGLNDQSCTMQSNTSKQSRKKRERKPEKVTKKTNSRL